MGGGGEVVDTILTLVSRGNATLAEIARLTDVIPTVFRDGKGEGIQVIYDFSYFKTSDAIEVTIEKDQKLQDLDNLIKDEHLSLLSRFYQCFESIQRYSSDLVQLLEDLEEGKFIQESLESIMQQRNGKQLMAEAIYLLGVQLLTVDELVPGPVRERLLVSYYRYSGQAGHSAHFDTVCSLLRSTGYLTSNKRPVGYPESLFSRVTVQKEFVSQLVGRLRSDDLYNMLPNYPEPSDRSTALAGQASMLYVLLYFLPNILNQETAMMREIVDKFFPDNWVISVYLGTMVWLPDAWDQYKAAKAAIANTTGNSEVKLVASRQGAKLRSLLPRLQELLQEGAVTQDTLLDNVQKVMTVVRESNVCLRWLLLHTARLQPCALQHKRSRQLKDLAVEQSGVEQLDLYHILVATARLELLLRQLYSKVLAQRERSWARLRAECVDRMEELAEVFGGKQKLSRVEPNSRLQKWLKDRAGQMKMLDVTNPTAAAKMAVQLMQALDDAKEFHQLEANLQVAQYLQETREGLHGLVRLASTKEDVLVQLQIVSDLSYGWRLMHNMTPIMQQQVRADPGMVSALRATFLKLSAAMEVAMVRLGEGGSRDLVSVSQFYSRQMVTYIRTVLQVIPAAMFSLLEQVVDLQTGLEDLPTRLEKDRLKELSQLDQRYEIARLTHAVSVLTSGILAMRTTLVGVVEVDPRKLLEEGVRCELVKRVAGALDTTLTFNPKSKDRAGDLVAKIKTIGTAMEGFRKSFEYIQDYINIPGLRLWQEEVSRIVNHAVEREAAGFLRGTGDMASQFQSTAVPIPVFPPAQGDKSRNFMGRLTREVMAVTEPGTTLYVESHGAWYQAGKPHQETGGPGLMKLLEGAVGVAGLAGLDRLLGLMAVTCGQGLGSWLSQELKEDGELGKVMQGVGGLLPEGELVNNPSKVYSQQGGKLGRAWQVLHPAVNELGQITLLRKSIACRLSSSSSFDAKLLHTSLSGLQDSVMVNATNPDCQFPRKGESILLEELCSYLRWSGLDDPTRQVYSPLSTPIPGVDLLLSLLVMSLTSRMVFSINTGFLVGKKGGDVDGWIVLVGVSTILQQQHPQVTHRLVERLGQAAQSWTVSGEGQEANVILLFLRYLQETTGLPKCAVADTVSPALFYNTSLPVS